MTIGRERKGRGREKESGRGGGREKRQRLMSIPNSMVAMVIGRNKILLATVDGCPDTLLPAGETALQ